MPLRGAVVQSLKVRQICLRWSGRPLTHVGRHVGIGEHHAAQADEVDHAGAHHMLAHIGQPLLQVGVAGADDRSGPGAAALSCGRGVDLPCHAGQRILGRLIAVGGREERRALDVRVVVGAAGRQADQPDAQVAAAGRGTGVGSSRSIAGTGAVAAEGIA